VRFTAQHVQQWHTDGFVIIERFFDRREYEPVLQDFEVLYRDASRGEATSSLYQSLQRDDRSSRARQFLNIHVLPYEGSSAINLLSLHPELIAFARALLGAPSVRLYQSHTWAKYTGQADYDQEFHCDHGNHTLIAPADDPALRTVDFVIYLTDVSEEHGAMRYVTKPDVLAALGRPALSAPSLADQAALRQVERTVAVPPGSLVAHGIDTMHRGSNLTAPDGRRFSMTVGYKAAGSEHIGFHVWQATPERPWHLVLNHATPEQLECLGIPKPGHPYWTRRTLELTQSRWPDWNMAEYFAAFDSNA
jgi:ectoine hydroxylase-related dioxygenase (phytanoyl-CoA dioxygenase family)